MHFLSLSQRETERDFRLENPPISPFSKGEVNGRRLFQDPAESFVPFEKNIAEK